ncbi:MAG: hypothetical protein ACRDAM_00250 [Casimicrobium sp.]
MAYSCDIVTSSTVVRGALIGFFLASSLSSGSATFDESVRLSSTTVVADTATLGDSAIEGHYQIIRETAVLNNRVEQTALSINDVFESCRSRSRVIDTVADIAADAAVLDDSVALIVGAALRDNAALFSDRVEQTATLTTLVRERFRSTDKAVQFITDTVREIASFSDSAISAATAVSLVSESASLADRAIETAVLVDVARDSASFSGRIDQVAGTVDVVNDTAVLLGYVVEPLLGEAWTASTDTFAMSRYTAFRFNSVAVIDGKLIAAGDGGLYELTGGLDGAQPITALLKSGLSDAGDPQQKRVREVFFGYEADATLSAKVSGTGTGDELGYMYQLPAKTADAAIANRLKVGRGMRSRYWRFEISNPSGEDFKISEIRANVETLSRKV